MGLDSMWKMPGSNEPGYVDGDFTICGGLYSDNGNDSFRGKVYNDVFKDATQTSLYDDLTADQVRDLLPKLEAYCFRPRNSQYGVTVAEWNAFVRMWKAHAEAGHWLWAFY